ncbi:hypothetical protein AGIG_G20041 [Arapaima gigas]
MSSRVCKQSSKTLQPKLNEILSVAVTRYQCNPYGKVLSSVHYEIGSHPGWTPSSITSSWRLLLRKKAGLGVEHAVEETLCTLGAVV